MGYLKIKHRGYCLNCGKSINQWLRIDSKFCSDNCRVDWFRFIKINAKKEISVTDQRSNDS